MSRNARYGGSPQSGDSESDEDLGKRKFNAEPVKTINEVLMKALEEAANPGFGDEEPEVMPAPDGTGTGAHVALASAADAKEEDPHAPRKGTVRARRLRRQHHVWSHKYVRRQNRPVPTRPEPKRASATN